MSVTTLPGPHHVPGDLSDRLAFAITRALRFFADAFFARRYGHRAVVLETIAAVPGMVAGALQHLRSLRRMEGDRGWIRALLDEAENERMHLMIFMEIVRPSRFERMLVVLAQGAFYNAFFLLYLLSAKTAHRVVGYFEEEAVHSYTEYLAGVDGGARRLLRPRTRQIRLRRLKPAGAQFDHGLRHARATFRASSCTQESRSNASWLVAYGLK